MKNLIFLFLASATFFSCATSKKQLKFTELKGAFYSLTYSDGTLITSGYTYQNSYEKLGDAQKWINDMKKDSKYKKALEEKITKYNSYYGTNFCIPLEAKPTWSRGTQKELLYVFDVNKLNNHFFENDKDIKTYKTFCDKNIDIKNASLERIILNSNPCLWNQIKVIFTDEEYKEVIESGDLRCNPNFNDRKFGSYFRKYPNSKYGQELEDIFMKTNLAAEPSRYPGGYDAIREFSTVRPSLFKRLESLISDNLYNSLYNKEYSYIFYGFLDTYPNNSRATIFKKRADELKRQEDAEAAAEKRRKEREAQEQERWERNNNSSSSDVNDRSEKIKVKLMETKNEKNILSPDRVIYKYRLKQGSRTKNIEIYYTPTEDSWSISCDFFGAPHSKEEAIEKCLDDFDCNGCDWEWEY